MNCTIAIYFTASQGPEPAGKRTSGNIEKATELESIEYIRCKPTLGGAGPHAPHSSGRGKRKVFDGLRIPRPSGLNKRNCV